MATILFSAACHLSTVPHRDHWRKDLRLAQPASLGWLALRHDGRHDLGSGDGEQVSIGGRVGDRKQGMVSQHWAPYIDGRQQRGLSHEVALVVQCEQRAVQA